MEQKQEEIQLQVPTNHVSLVYLPILRIMISKKRSLLNFSWSGYTGIQEEWYRLQ